MLNFVGKCLFLLIYINQLHARHARRKHVQRIGFHTAAALIQNITKCFDNHWRHTVYLVLQYT